MKTHAGWCGRRFRLPLPAFGHRKRWQAEPPAPPTAPGLLAAAILLAYPAIAAAQSFPPGPQVLTFFSDVDDSDQPYALYLPKNFDAAKKYPLVVSLHGEWSNHRLNMRRVFGSGNRPGETDAEATRFFPQLKNVDFIVASPLARGTMGYHLIAEKDVYDMMADVKRRFPIDEDRVYLTGLSMGGGGALWLGLTRPDLWAAIAAVCPDPPPGTDELAGNALHIPVHLFHGDRDDVVPASVSRTWQAKLLDLAVNAEYIEYPGIHHNAWDYAYKNGAIFDWFAKYKRDRTPQEVRFTTEAYRYDSAYWVRIDGLTPGTPASIDARFAAKNRIDVTTAGIEGFTMKVAGHPSFASNLPLHVSVDGTEHRLARVRESVSFRRTGAAWRPGEYAHPAAAKRPGLEGPIGAAVSARHIYVYGTAQASADEIERRREEARHAADWSAPNLKLFLDLPVLADKDIGPADAESGNLVLFGTKETNRLIARFSDKLPLQLNAGAADYGLMFVAPVGNRYVVVNSGLPFWIGAKDAKVPGGWYIGMIPRLLDRFGDYVVFKGSLANIVAEGRFDAHWKLPAADREKLRSTGAVEIR